MTVKRRASANWKGTGMDGKGLISTQSTTLNNAQLSFKSRFDEGVGTNPEELIAAAHAGCFTMQLSFLLSELGLDPENLHTDSIVTFVDGSITHLELDLVATVSGISVEDFEKTAQRAKEICPVSKLVKADITITTKLN